MSKVPKTSMAAAATNDGGLTWCSLPDNTWIRMLMMTLNMVTVMTIIKMIMTILVNMKMLVLILVLLC